MGVQDAAFDALASALPELVGASPIFSGDDPVLATRLRLGAAAAAAIGGCATAAARIWQSRGGAPQTVSVDRRRAAASLAGFRHLRLDGRPFPAAQGDVPTMAIYRCADGRWIHLHGALPHLRDGTLALLECADERAAIAAAVAQWPSFELEDALAEARQCGAVLRTAAEWGAHPQGLATAAAPLVEVIRIGDAPPRPWTQAARPLDGVRVLDLTRILAGPTCARTLAEHGAQVLHVSSPELPNIPIFIPDTGHGKRTAFLNLTDSAARDSLAGLLDEADVFSQGYRTGALDRIGFGHEDTARRRPGIIYVSINCYGHSGPWVHRPGWEQLAQSCTGIALMHSNRSMHADTAPEVIPAAPADYCTGYLAAQGVMAALSRRALVGGSWHVRASLARTAMWIRELGMTTSDEIRHPPTRSEIESWSMTRDTDWGRLSALSPIAEMSATPPHWDLPAAPLGSHVPRW